MIYLLEDDDNIRKLVLYTFSSQNIDAMGFAKPSEFWKQIDKEIPDIVLLDIMLPEEDGLQVLKKLRNNSATADVTVIMLTAKGSEYDKVIVLEEYLRGESKDGHSRWLYTAATRAAKKLIIVRNY